MKSDRNWDRGDSCMLPHWGKGSPKLKDSVFPRQTSLTVSFLTDLKALCGLLPPGVEPANKDRPIVNFRLRFAEGVDWVPGSFKPALGVSVPVRVPASKQTLPMVHWLVLFEDDPMSVILGREIFGVAKLCAPIYSQRDIRGHWNGVVSEQGYPLIGMQFDRGVAITGTELDEMRKRSQDLFCIGYRYSPDVRDEKVENNYLTEYPQKVEIDEAWRATGDVTLFDTTPDTHIWTHHVMQGLRELPLLEKVDCLITQGAGLLRLGQGSRIAQ